MSNASVTQCTTCAALKSDREEARKFLSEERQIVLETRQSLLSALSRENALKDELKYRVSDLEREKALLQEELEAWKEETNKLKQELERLGSIERKGEVLRMREMAQVTLKPFRSSSYGEVIELSGDESESYNTASLPISKSQHPRAAKRPPSLFQDSSTLENSLLKKPSKRQKLCNISSTKQPTQSIDVTPDNTSSSVSNTKTSPSVDSALTPTPAAFVWPKKELLNAPPSSNSTSLKKPPTPDHRKSSSRSPAKAILRVPHLENADLKEDSVRLPHTPPTVSSSLPCVPPNSASQQKLSDDFALDDETEGLAYPPEPFYLAPPPLSPNVSPNVLVSPFGVKMNIASTNPPPNPIQEGFREDVLVNDGFGKNNGRGNRSVDVDMNGVGVDEDNSGYGASNILPTTPLTFPNEESNSNSNEGLSTGPWVPVQPPSPNSSLVGFSVSVSASASVNNPTISATSSASIGELLHPEPEPRRNSESDANSENQVLESLGPALTINPPPDTNFRISRMTLNKLYHVTPYQLMARFSNSIFSSPSSSSASSSLQKVPKQTPTMRTMLFPFFDENPNLPATPGAPGVILTKRTDILEQQPVSIFINYGGRGKTPSLWDYVGEYELWKGGELSGREFERLGEKTQETWASCILTRARDVWSSTRARIYLRKAGISLTAENIRAEQDKIGKKGKGKGKGQPGEVTLGDVLGAFRRGEERLDIIAMKCVSYDHAFVEHMKNGSTQNQNQSSGVGAADSKPTKIKVKSALKSKVKNVSESSPELNSRRSSTKPVPSTSIPIPVPVPMDVDEAEPPRPISTLTPSSSLHLTSSDVEVGDSNSNIVTVRRSKRPSRTPLRYRMLDVDSDGDGDDGEGDQDEDYEE